MGCQYILSFREMGTPEMSGSIIMPCPHSGIHTAMEMKEVQTHRSAKTICAKRSPQTKKKKSKLQKNAYRSFSVNIYLWPRAARFRPGTAGLPAGSQPHWRPPGTQQGPTTHPQRAESRPVQPRFTPPWVRSRRVSSLSGHNDPRGPHTA